MTNVMARRFNKAFFVYRWTREKDGGFVQDVWFRRPAGNLGAYFRLRKDWKMEVKIRCSSLGWNTDWKLFDVEEDAIEYVCSAVAELERLSRRAVAEEILKDETVRFCIVK